MITTTELISREQRAEERGISREELMERAGEKIAEIIGKQPGKKILCVCYQGNNGGDGFCAAKKLLATHQVKVFFVGKEEQLKVEAKKNYEALKEQECRSRVKIFVSEPCEQEFDIIVDALLGIGMKAKELKEPLISAINLINRGKYIISIDTPTGINPDTGEKAKVFVVPDLIITIHDYKPGLAKYKRLTKVIDIGL